jgi:hypothetical protein
MKYFLLGALAFLCTFSSASAKQKKSKTKTTGKEILSIKLRHGACFGHCPIYSITVDKNGLVTYTGERFIQDSGTYEKNKGAKAAQKLFAKFNAYHVDTCSDSYHNRIPDLAGLYFDITYSTGVKRIYNAHFGPAFLKGELTEAMDNIGRVDATWKKVPPGQKK